MPSTQPATSKPAAEHAPVTLLGDFEETINSLAAYLIAAPERHPKQILNSRGDSLSDTPQIPRLRLTQHRAAALLAYGLPANAAELVEAREWFMTPFPSLSADTIDVAEMLKLEGLLNLRPEDPSVVARLEQLALQRTDHYFELYHDSPDHNPSEVFETLWALKLMLLAWDKGITHDFITRDEARDMLDRLLNQNLQDKDMALALRLVYDLDERLASHHTNYLDRLIQQAEAHNGFWGISQGRWEHVRPIIEVMHQEPPQHMLTPGLISRQEKMFQQLILNACYVIENLAPLMGQYPQIAPAIHRAMSLWWQQFQGDNAARSIASLFRHEYNYLMLLCRTMVAVNAYIGEPAGARSWLGPLRKMARELNGDDWPERQSIIRALREWFEIDLGKYSKLKLGLSDAEVYRIEPHVSNRTEGDNNLLNNRSLVVKYGPVQEIEQERDNYRRLSSRMQEFFVAVPDWSYTDERGQCYIIMEDLHQYRTLFENYDQLLKPEYPRLLELLGQFLVDVHNGDKPGPGYATRNHVRDIYILPLLQHIDNITDTMQLPSITQQMALDDIERFHEVEGHVSSMIGAVMQHQRHFEGFPLAFMHGDLHSRNIMIRVIEQDNRPQAELDLQFKLIDLESLRLDGDAAHDLGQFLVDLDLLQTNDVPNRTTITRDVAAKIERLRDHLKAAYRDFAQAQGDTTFDLRLELARARSLMRVAKSKAKLCRSKTSKREFNEAKEALGDAITLVEMAKMRLERVRDGIQ